MKINEITLTETYLNAFSTEDKSKYAKEIWDMLQQSYKKIGGIQGKGFTSIPDMIRSNAMFKIGMRDGKPRMVTVYKDKNGRKRVAMGTDGTEEGKWFAINILRDEMLQQRSYGEFSGQSFGATRKQIPDDVLVTFLVPATEVAAKLGKQIQIGAGDDIIEIPNDPYTEFYYQRKIGDEIHTKLMYGDPSSVPMY